MVGIENFLNIATIIQTTNISNDAGYYSAPANIVMQYPLESDLEPTLFWELLSIYISKLNANQTENIKAARRRAQNGSRT